MRARSAAVDAQSPSGFRVERGLVPGEPREEHTWVIFGPVPGATGWVGTEDGRPRADLLARVRPLTG